MASRLRLISAPCCALALLIILSLLVLPVAASAASRPARRPSPHVTRRTVLRCTTVSLRRRGRMVRVRRCRRVTVTSEKTPARATKKPSRPVPAPKPTAPKTPTTRPTTGPPTTGPTSGPPTTGPTTTGPTTPPNPPVSPPNPPVAPPTPRAPSAWDRPALVNPTTVTISEANRNLKLDQTRDYVLVCPPGPVSLTWALVVWGGHNVVFENCDLEITGANWVAQLKNQTGTLWLHDVHFGGSQLTGGVQLQEPGATVVMRDVLFDTVYGSYRTNHAECVQTWSGPERLLIDGLTCSTTYQGLFLLPNQWDSTTRETVWDLRNIDIAATGAYALWLGDVQPSNLGVIPSWNVQNVFVSGPGEPRNYDGTSDGAAWNGVIGGSPPGGAFVRAVTTGAAGIDEGTSPLALAGEEP